MVSSAFAATTSAVFGQIGEINHRVKELEAELAGHFEQHRDAAIYRSMPGLGVVLGARVLGEFGDDPDRYESAKSRRNYAGTSPLTVASERKHTRACALHPQREALRRRRPMGAVLAEGQPRLPSVLRSATRCRRPPPPGVARPRQPPGRLPARLPQESHPPRRGHRLGPPPGSGTTRRLTP